MPKYHLWQMHHKKRLLLKTKDPGIDLPGSLSYQGCFDGQPVSRLKAALPGSFYTLRTPPFQ